MGRPRRPPKDLTTDEALKRLFPRRAVTRVKKEAKKADEQATKKDNKG
jgi:hypothetical protein